ncbi:hypothetical_protein [Leishmania braziliensis MHOM/BR/75/M2904]|uniref:Hypothetical_protein n=1 Tax=Leishmania braziliensis MHOM/BR/75/M2904 TaxID=420245 RepID=A0A3P3ZB18_LEIBR|nr:unnamed protein product [Leishmania braziliensis]SYZ67439.1 hypothetical_protein [Leishmania braziliensis MHOM/BR/75/M2904]
MADLRAVELPYSDFQGSLPKEWSLLRVLQSVGLAGSAFCGCILLNWRGISALAKNVAVLAAGSTATCSLINCLNRESLLRAPNTTPVTPPVTAAPAPSDRDTAMPMFLSGLAVLMSLLRVFCRWTCGATLGLQVTLWTAGLH